MAGVMAPDTSRPRPQQRRAMLRTIVLIAGSAITVFTSFWLLDYFFFSGPHGSRGPLEQLLRFAPEPLRTALGTRAQIIAGVLGIAITVVWIVVRLAATRYTSRVADMFF